MKVKVLVAQLCLTLCNPIDCSLQGSSVCGILQARILEWVAISFSRRSSQSRYQTWSLALQEDSFLSEPTGKTVSITSASHKFTEVEWVYFLHTPRKKNTGPSLNSCLLHALPPPSTSTLSLPHQRSDFYETAVKESQLKC